MDKVKKLFILLMAFAAALCLTTCAQTQPEPEPDYLDAMVRAAARGDVRAGHTAESMRELSQGKSEDYVPVSFDDLYTLSRYIYLKYGSYRCSDELRLCAGEVVLNRVASPEYPNSIEGVICQSGQVNAVDTRAFDACREPSAECVRVALRLLLGERMLEPSVVLLTDYPADGIYAMFCDRLLGNTYFYKSDALELYRGDGTVDAAGS